MKHSTEIYVSLKYEKILIKFSFNFQFVFAYKKIYIY